MNIYIPLGWWILPLTITVVSMGWALLTPEDRSGMYSFDLMPLIRFAGALIVTLAVWLVWSLLT